ncbi:MAG: TetR/AcrR family transcriptional regulator [Dehalococcoidia bacterium]|nr:TetR/AcrR family transcriptional regulator [Dehalococcoidia bacterium]
MSVEGVASEAGVGKTTIYRRYASKEELAVAAVGEHRDNWGPRPDTGSARADMVEMLVQNKEAFERGPGFQMICALLVEERRNPELLELFRERIIRPRRDDALMILQRGVRRGEIRADANLEVAIHAMVGAMFMRHILGAPESRERIERTADTIWGGLACASHSQTSEE